MASVVLVTIPEDKAEGLARKILGEKVCACVNILKGVKSLFWWEGKISEAKEALLIIKTKDSLVPRLQVAVKENHPHAVPEIIAIHIDSINKEYLRWLSQEVDGYGFTSKT